MTDKNIEIPVQIEQTLYTNISLRYMRANKRPHKVKVCFIGLNKSGGFFNVVYDNDSMYSFKFKEIGKYIFLTQEEALKAFENGDKNEN